MSTLHVMLPTQYLRQGGGQIAEPEKRLMLAVLQTVLDDCRGRVAAATVGSAPAGERAYLQARAYVESRDRTWPFSFENICEAIGLDADLVRRGLRSPQPLV